MISTIPKAFYEFILLMIVFPIILCTEIHILIKVSITLLSLFYILIVLFNKKYSFFIRKELTRFKNHFYRILSIFIGVLIASIYYVYIFTPEKLFLMPLQKTTLWIALLFIYSIFSVIPQEIIYRSFFFMRYNELFKNEKLKILINAIVFSLAHLFFRNILVLVITFVGGLLFAYTYTKTRSLLLVSIEHALYGCCLLTVGLGDQLGFPS